MGHKIKIINVVTNIVITVDTIGEAGNYLESSNTTVSRYIKNKTIFKAKYLIINLNIKK